MLDHLPPLPPPPEPLIIQALTYLLQPQTFPTLVCCNMGRHRSGTVVGCYRKLQRWALSSILEEYRRYAGAKVRVLNEQVSHTDVRKLADCSSLSCLTRIWWLLRRLRSRSRRRLEGRRMERKNAGTKWSTFGAEERANYTSPRNRSSRSAKVRTTTAWDFLGTNYLIGPDLSAQVWMAPTIWVVNCTISHRSAEIRYATAHSTQSLFIDQCITSTIYTRAKPTKY
jgi:hypothetical protein